MTTGPIDITSDDACYSEAMAAAEERSRQQGRFDDPEDIHRRLAEVRHYVSDSDVSGDAS